MVHSQCHQYPTLLVKENIDPRSQGIESDLCSTKWHTPITLGLEAILEPKPFDFTADRIKRETATRTQWFGAFSSCLLCLTVFPIKSL